MISLYYRKTLNMTRGKITSQCAHALVGYFLGMLDRDKRSYRDPQVPSYWDSCDIRIEAVSDEVFEKQCHNAVLTITDAGRTMFNGIPTNTVCLCDDGDGKAYYYPNAHVDETSEIATKQIIAVHRRQPNKPQLAYDGVRASLNAARWAVDSWLQGHEEPALLYWWSHSFAKITVQLPADHESLSEPWVQYGDAYALPPLFQHDTELFNHLKLF